MTTRTGEVLGRVGGVAFAPVTATVSALRGSRMFHPCGSTFRAEVRAVGAEPPWLELGLRLEGGALVRLSSAWWKAREWPDVLGCAVRFTASPVIDERARPGDQDLLFATIRRPWTMPFAPLGTRYRDYLANHYFAVAPFRTDAGVIEFRLVPLAVPRATHANGKNRQERLLDAVRAGEARFSLEARPYRRLIDLLRHRRWHRVAEIALLSRVELDARALRFDAYRDGRGIHPVGFVHALRIAAYAASQSARPQP